MNTLPPHSLPGARGKAVLARGPPAIEKPRPCRSSVRCVGSCVFERGDRDRRWPDRPGRDGGQARSAGWATRRWTTKTMAGQRLERLGLDVAVGVVVMRPGKTARAASGGVVSGMAFSAQAAFRKTVRCVLAGIVSAKGPAAEGDLLHVGRRRYVVSWRRRRA